MRAWTIAMYIVPLVLVACIGASIAWMLMVFNTFANVPVLLYIAWIAASALAIAAGAVALMLRGKKKEVQRKSVEIAIMEAMVGNDMNEKGMM